jgi:hypothetical protein
MQDWEYQIADPVRIDEYLAIYGDGTLTDDERFTLMKTVLQSFEDLNAELASDPRWSAVLELLDRNVDLHVHSIWYWADADNQMFSESWRVSPFMSVHAKDC